MKLLLDFLPILIFFGVYKTTGDLITATAVLIPVTIVQVAVVYWLTKTIEKAGFSEKQDTLWYFTSVDKERIGLGIKQLGDDPFASVAGHKRGDTVTCTVVEVEENGLQVTFGDTDYPGYIRRGDLARDRDDQRPQRFAAGDKVDAMITNVDRSSRRINLSIRALEIEEEKQAVEQYGSTDSGASLGDILGAAMNEARGDED